jgi:hypothetical protein
MPQPRREPVRRPEPAYEAVREEQRREALRLAQAEHEEPRHEEPKREDSKVLLEGSGLVMIETDRSKAHYTPQIEEPQHLGRPRRERPKPPPQEEEALQQVETTRK